MNSDPICKNPPTRESLFRACWSTLPPLKDGTSIVAIGQVICPLTGSEDSFEDGAEFSIGTSVEPFVAAVRWEKDQSGYEGWHYADSGMTLAQLDDKVVIFFWNPYPAADAKARKEAV